MPLQKHCLSLTEAPRKTHEIFACFGSVRQLLVVAGPPNVQNVSAPNAFSKRSERLTSQREPPSWPLAYPSNLT